LNRALRATTGNALCISGHEVVHAGGAFVLHNLRAQTATCGTTNDGVNHPSLDGLGSVAGQDTGVVHAIQRRPT
jgi:hypothetical protein